MEQLTRFREVHTKTKDPKASRSRGSRHYLMNLIFSIKMSTRSTLLVFLFLINSCSPEDQCIGEHRNRGLIVGDFDSILVTICDGIVYSEGEMVFRTRGELLDQIWCSRLSSNPNDSIDLEIDFNKHSLVGHHTEGAAPIQIIRKFKIDHARKECTYKIRTRSCGIEKLSNVTHGSMNLVLVPRIPSDYTVKFDVQ